MYVLILITISLLIGLPLWGFQLKLNNSKSSYVELTAIVSKIGSVYSLYVAEEEKTFYSGSLFFKNKDKVTIRVKKDESEWYCVEQAVRILKVMLYIYVFIQAISLLLIMLSFGK